jgi:hypothetical protein
MLAFFIIGGIIITVIVMRNEIRKHRPVKAAKCADYYENPHHKGEGGVKLHGQEKVTMSKTLYISDLDGTLLNSSAELSGYTADALNALIAEGLHFSVATARTLATADKILAGLKLQFPVVLMNGVVIYDFLQRRYIQVHTLMPETVAEIIAMLRKCGATGLMYELKDGAMMTYYESLDRKPIRDFVEDRRTRFNKIFTQSAFSDVSPEHIIFFTLIGTFDLIQPVYDARSTLPGLNFVKYKDTYSGEWLLEIYSGKASKEYGVQFLRSEYGFDRVVGFGDNLNDLPMFEACDVKVAVENAKPEVKAAADHICGCNGDDGVVKWIKDLPSL